MSVDMLASFVGSLKSSKTGGIVTTAKELRESQFGVPLKHYAQQYLFGATGLRLQVFNSIQGQKEAGKSTLLFDLMGSVCADAEHGGESGLAVLYEMEGKISPTILHSILVNHGERAEQAVVVRHGMTLEEAMKDLNKEIIPSYMKSAKDFSVPLIIGFDSIGGSAVGDTVQKVKTEGATGKGYYEKQHIMKYFCENQGVIFSRLGIPIVVICINQEREGEKPSPFLPPKKTITGGKAQLFKDGHMISASKKGLATGDGNIVYLKTTKTSYCDPREIEVKFAWNRFGVKQDDAYEAHFMWGLASAKCIAEPDKGVGEIRDICNVKIDDDLVTCKQLGLTKVKPDEFEEALMADTKLLDQLYTYQKIEKLRDMKEYAAYMAANNGAQVAEPEEPLARKPAAKRKKAEQPKANTLFETQDQQENADG